MRTSTMFTSLTAAAAALLAACINIQPADPNASPTPGPAADSAAAPPVPPQANAARSGPAPLEFHLQLSVQEQLPRAKGLGRTMRYPASGSDLPIFTGRVGIVYEWRPKDGLEDRINPNTKKPWGPIWKDSIAEQMLPDNLQRHLDSVDKWVGAYIAADFEGVVALDVERWPMKGDSFHQSKKSLDDLARLAADKTQAELLGRFMRLTEEKVRAARPRVSGWGWWAMGEMHPGFPVWHAALYKSWRERDVAGERAAMDGRGIPFPSFYFPSSLPNPAERALVWPKLQENWTLLYGADRLARDGYAYLNVRHAATANKEFANKPVTREQFHECVEAAWSLGIRRFVIWDAIDGPEVRDTDQKFIDEILIPEVRAYAERDRRERKGG